MRSCFLKLLDSGDRRFPQWSNCSRYDVGEEYLNPYDADGIYHFYKKEMLNGHAPPYDANPSQTWFPSAPIIFFISKFDFFDTPC